VFEDAARHRLVQQIVFHQQEVDVGQGADDALAPACGSASPWWPAPGAARRTGWSW
jgi:hypothetical protein